MTAELKFFKDRACTQEVPQTDLGTDLLLAPIEGLNGNTGETFDTVVYVKNIGSRAALHTQVFIKNVDDREFLSVVPSFLGDIKELEVKQVTFTATIPRWTKNELQAPLITFDYYTLPPIDETFYNPYTDTREVSAE